MIIKHVLSVIILSIIIVANTANVVRKKPGAFPAVSGPREPKTSPAAKPNIIIILADDMGYSDLGCFGSEIHTPNLDAMAQGGLRMTQFYNASRCCPTRASLLTGLFQHQAGVGDMVNTRPEPAYQGYLNRNCVTIAEALKQGGYHTYMAGKWHVGQAPEHWPRKRGFDRYFGLIDGASSYFSLKPYRPDQKLTIALDDSEYTIPQGFYATNAYTDYAIKFIDENKTTQKPFFLYLAYTAPHWPLHALPEDIARYKGKYMKGWDKLRQERFGRMQQMGLMDKNTALSARDENVPAWETLSDEDKKSWDEKMAVYAAMIDRMDRNIGRIRQKLRETGQDKNTVILFLSDNGGSYESISGSGFTPEMIAAGKKTSSDSSSFTSYGFSGANLSNTPFRLYKRYEQEGGTATPFIAYCPAYIKPGRIDKRPAHIIDIMATCLDIAGVAYPKTFHGNAVIPSSGISLLPLFNGKSFREHEALFFEHEGNRAVRQGDWKLVSVYPDNTWHLYNMKTDRTELHDVSANEPGKVKELDSLYTAWASKTGVIPFGELDKKKKTGE